jgi:hypothetical protein
MNFDIDALEAAAQNTYDLAVGHRDGPPDDNGNPTKGDPVGFRVLGASSDEYQKIDRAIQVLNLKESATRRKLLDTTTDDGATAVIDSVETRIDMLIKACVVDWFGFTIKGVDGAAPFTQENLQRVLKAKPGWRNLIVGAIENEANFTAG